MRSTSIALAALLSVAGFVALAPPAAAADIPVPVGVCVAKPDAQWGCHGNEDVCVSAFSWVPQCADVPCYRPVDCISIRDPCDLICTDPCEWGCDEPARPTPPGECMQVYREYDLGVVRIVMRDSCHVEVEQHILE